MRSEWEPGTPPSLGTAATSQRGPRGADGCAHILPDGRTCPGLAALLAATTPAGRSPQPRRQPPAAADVGAVLGTPRRAICRSLGTAAWAETGRVPALAVLALTAPALTIPALTIPAHAAPARALARGAMARAVPARALARGALARAAPARSAQARRQT